MNEWREERVVATVPYCWCCEHLIRNKEFKSDRSSEHHGCWKLCGDFEPGFDLMSGIYPKCPLPKVMAYHYMSEDGKCLLFKVKPVAEVEEDKA
jgi:hypothetical protein